MVTLNSLRPVPGTRKAPKRLGRGTGSGQGCTAGHGNNGEKCRSGARYKAYFEGGQTPLSRRIGKRGFVHSQREVIQAVNLGVINAVESDDKEIDASWLFANGLIRKKDVPVKILGDGEITRSLTIKADAFSQSARDKIVKAKGKAEDVKSA